MVEIFEMARLSKRYTKLPYDLWIDSVGKDRNNKHNSPRIKVDVEGDLIPISISEDPKVIVSGKENFKDKNKVTRYIRNNLDVFIKHWNRELDDTEALIIFMNRGNVK